MSDTVRVLGADRLERTLRRAATDVGDQSELNERTASLMARGMRDRAPRRSGRLAASIVGASTDSSASAATPLIYGGVQEYGSAAKHIRPQPFARPTFAEVRPRYQVELASDIQRDLGKVKGA